MPGTYTQLLVHVVFSTRGRTPWITTPVAEKLHPYLGGIIRAEGGNPLAIGGVEDHVHLYLRWKPDGSLSDLMRTVKSRSSKWLHDTFPGLKDFAWQEGYGAFSVSKSRESAVITYIQNQPQHHQREDFRSELRAFLRRHLVDFEEKYLFE